MPQSTAQWQGETLLAKEISACTQCHRLAAYCHAFTRAENQKVSGSGYWAKPVPGFGDLGAQLLIIGLAPGAHGANRTGRPFTGDGAGEVLYGALHRHGFANQGTVVDRSDGLLLHNVYITNAVKCVPPSNRPTGPEKRACLPWLSDELRMLPSVRVILAMGKDAFESFIRLQKEQGTAVRLADLRFQHGGVYPFETGPLTLIATYHFSRYNMNTRRLTEEMVDALFDQVKGVLKTV